MNNDSLTAALSEGDLLALLGRGAAAAGTAPTLAGSAAFPDLKCLNQVQSLTVGTTDYYVQHYVFPVQFILGVAGNCINLIVLLSAGMKNQVSAGPVST